MFEESSKNLGMFLTQLKDVVYIFLILIYLMQLKNTRTAIRDEYEITEAIQILIDHECKVGISDVVQEDL